ncbi:MAG: FAD-dependent oxidoreductase [Verrucomicrobiae bacterium]|nr:FAD-dependent oxidoreductase [Verrucomicrobiae bacterium]
MRCVGVFLAAAASLGVARGGHDIVIYGGTSAGLMAAAQAQRMGKTAIVIEPGRHIGGLTTGGLGWTDIGNKAAIGGLARDFYRRIKKKYDEPARWVQEAKEDYFTRRKSPNSMNEDAMWTFEPKVASEVFRDVIAEHKIELVVGARLDRRPGKGVVKEGGRIAAIAVEDGRRFDGAMFIDATYEGDLMAAAGVRYAVGREANAVYGETINGVQARNAKSHQFPEGANVDPYVRRGDPSSGVLPGIDPKGPGEEGSGDHRVQAYCFRMCLTEAPENMVAIQKPEGYDEREYELLLRYIESGKYHRPESKYDPLPNKKTDTNNHGAVSTDYIGMNYGYPEGDYATRERIIRRHEVFQKGYLWTLQNHPRVPEDLRNWYRRWGLPKDEFPDHGHWTPQLYIREARRMVAGVVMTEHHCRGEEKAEDPVGMGAYNMDSHNVQRYITPEGFVRNEGDLQVGVPPYPISYRAIVPRREECENLFVPVCLSASHIAYGSIRMEPVFMILAQSSATAASMAIDGKSSVQDVPFARLRERLLADGQVLEWTGPLPRRAAPREKFEGIVLDDADAEKVGEWNESGALGARVGEHYVHDDNTRDGKKALVFRVKAGAAGPKKIRVIYAPSSNRASRAGVTIAGGGRSEAVTIDQRTEPEWLGPFELPAEFEVRVSNQGADGHVVVDGLQVMESAR